MKGTTSASYSADLTSPASKGCWVSQEAFTIRWIPNSSHRVKADSQRIQAAIWAYYFSGSEFSTLLILVCWQEFLLLNCGSYWAMSWNSYSQITFLGISQIYSMISLMYRYKEDYKILQVNYSVDFLINLNNLNNLNTQ